jgi:pyruvate kinase
MPQKRNTKIVATIGPASNSKEMIAELFEAGVNMFRLNFSHGTHDDHKAALNHIRALEKKKPGGPSLCSPICRDRSCASAHSRTARLR